MMDANTLKNMGEQRVDLVEMTPELIARLDTMADRVRRMMTSELSPQECYILLSTMRDSLVKHFEIVTEGEDSWSLEGFTDQTRARFLESCRCCGIGREWLSLGEDRTFEIYSAEQMRRWRNIVARQCKPRPATLPPVPSDTLQA
jgi:hypothetical protein